MYPQKNVDASNVGEDVTGEADGGGVAGLYATAAEFSVMSAVLVDVGHGSNSQLLLGFCLTMLPPGQKRTSAEHPLGIVGFGVGGGSMDDDDDDDDDSMGAPGIKQ